jgi:hypothetical protein
MSDFVTRLAERTLGAAPVVQPLIAPRFSPGPADHLMEPQGEPATMPEVPDRTPRPRTPPDTPMLAPDEAEAQNEESDTSITPPSGAPDGAAARPDPSIHAPTTGQEDLDVPDTSGSPRRPRASRESSPLETGMESMQEDRQTSSSTPPRPLARAPEPGSRTLLSGESVPLGRQDFPDSGPRRESRTTIADGRNPLPEPQFESAHRVESAPARRGVEESPRRLVPEGPTLDSFASEDGPGRAMLHSTMALAERARVTLEAPALPSGTGDPLETGEVTSKSEIVPAHSAAQGAAPVIVPRIVRHQPDQRQENSLGEARVLAPEPPAPTIKVAIGRIEVRAVTPPAPAQRETPARPEPMLSLDDYLTQRNGGRR